MPPRVRRFPGTCFVDSVDLGAGRAVPSFARTRSTDESLTTVAVKGYVLLAGSSGLPVALGLVLTPLITSNLSTLEYGSYINYLTVAGIVNIFVGLSSAGYISNAYVHPEAGNQIASSLAVFLLLTILPATFIAAVIAYLSKLPTIFVTVALVASGACAYVVSVFQAYIILRRKYSFLALATGAQALIQSSIVIILLLTSTVGLHGLILGHVVGLAASCLCALLLWRKLGFQFESVTTEMIKKIFLYSVPLVPHMFLSLASGSFDRWFLVGQGRMHELAVYSVAASIAGPVMILLDVGNKIYSPSVFENFRSTSASRRWLFRLMISYVVSGVLVAAAISALGYVFVLRAFSSDYSEAAWLCVGLSLSTSLFGLYLVASPILYYFNGTRFILASSICGALTTLAASIVLFGPLQLYGLIAGKMIGFLASGIVALGFALHILKDQHSLFGTSQ